MRLCVIVLTLFEFSVWNSYPTYCLSLNTKYLFYGVNKHEGFNLRRDVYIRIANLVRVLRDPSQYPLNALHRAAFRNYNWILVLPPWSQAFHWDGVSAYPWSTFFDVDALRKFIPVIEHHEFLQLETSTRRSTLDVAFQVLQFKSGSVAQAFDLKKPQLVADFDGVEKFTCENHVISNVVRNADNDKLVYFDETMQNSSIVTRDLYCLHGVLHAVELAGFLFRYIDEHPETKSIYIGAAENLINGVWSEWSQEYWTVRRSMVFAKHLVDIGDAFRKDVLGSEDEPDRTLRPPSWLHHPWPLSPALGGPYAAVHWRRGDFPESPSVHTAVNQTRQAIRKFQLDDQVSAVYLATDAENEDFLLFKQLLSPWAVYRFAPERTDLVPGELAVIDQWICAHARLFVGSSPSTFTFRIVEEREIMGFHPSSTYNAFCAVPGSDVVMYDDWRKRTDCEGLTPWSIVPEPLYTIHTPPFKNEL